MHTGVMVPGKPTYFSRFALKFAEILGAGIATAVSGYLVAHVGGFLSWPSQISAPTAAIEVPANATAKPTERPRNRATASVPAETDPHAASARDDQRKEPARPAAKPAEITSPVPTATTSASDADDKRSRGPTASRKPITDTHGAKTVAKEAADPKPTPKETADTKAREEAAVEDQVRAALANVDATRTPAPSTSAPPAATSAPQTAAIPQPQPIPASSNPAAPASTATSAAPPLAVPAAGPAASPLDIQNTAAMPPTSPVAASVSPQQSPAEPGPLTTVEIRSLPVAGVGETSPAAQGTAQADNETDTKAKSESDKGFFSTIAHLPDVLRAHAPGPGTVPPRPPMPVGE
jgi:hypothetical protein